MTLHANNIQLELNAGWFCNIASIFFLLAMIFFLLRARSWRFLASFNVPLPICGANDAFLSAGSIPANDAL